MGEMIRRYGRGATLLILLITAFWLVMLVVMPNITLLESSFRPLLPVTEIGGARDVYTLQNYAKVFNGNIDTTLMGVALTIPVHVYTLSLTIFYSVVVTILCFILAYPLSYFMAKIINPKSLPTMFLILFVPLWVSEVLRAFAWWIILALKGPLSSLLVWLHLIDQPVRWISGYNGVLIGLVYTYVLFMIFPVYNAMSSLDSNQIEAAEDLGAPWWRTHLRIVLPHCKPGIASGAVMVFMLSAGSLLVPTILGSTTSQWFTQTIQQWMFDALDWNTGAAYAFILLLICTLFVSLVMKLFRVKLSDIVK
jgi:spermidine/putrescine transport system permease protein